MEAKNDIEQMKTSSWLWTAAALIFTMLTLMDEDVPLLVSVILCAFALLSWCVTWKVESDEERDNRNLFE